MKNKQKEAAGQLIIPINGLDERIYPFQFTVDSAALLIGDQFGGPIVVTGELSHVGSQFLISGKAIGTVSAECDRCLAPTERETGAEFTSVFALVPAEGGDEDEEIVAIGLDASQIELDGEVRQALRLQVPMKNLCRDDCEGLCTSCGANLNNQSCTCEPETVDPRWEALKALRDSPSDDI